MGRSIYLAALATAAALSGCVSVPSNSQNPTATEQLLTRHAARRAVAEANLTCRTATSQHCVPRGAKVFIQTKAGDETAAGRYVVAVFAAHLAGSGLDLQDDRTHADVIVDLSIAAASIDDQDRVVGIPPVSIPAIPGKTSSTATTPEVSLWSTHTRAGVVEFSAIARDAQSGRLITAVGPLWARSKVVGHRLLTAISLGRQTEAPGVKAAIDGN